MIPCPSLTQRLRAFLRAEDGSQTVQFMMILPLLAGMLFVGLSSGIASINAALLDRAVDRTARVLREGGLADQSVGGLRTAICADMPGMTSCTTKLKVQLVAVARGANPIPTQTGCTDASATFTPVTTLMGSNQNAFLLLRACLPVAALASTLSASAASGFTVSSETMIAVR